MTTATLDRQNKDWALLVCADGRTWDVFGSNWKELKADALALAADLNIEIVCFNSDIPEFGGEG